jgi:hypothetical protein
LAYDAATSNTASNGSTFYRRYWKNASAETLMVDYATTFSTEPQITVTATTVAGASYAAVLTSGVCLTGNTTNVANRALCSNLGITLDKTTGTITFANTPVSNGWPNTPTYGQAGTMNGSFNFTPF